MAYLDSHCERDADRRLCAAVRPALGRAREQGRIDRLALLPALRQQLGVRPIARRRSRALVDPGGGRDRGDAALSRSHDGARDDVSHADRCARRHRRVGIGCGQPRPRARQWFAPPLAAPDHVHGRRRGDRDRLRAATGVRVDRAVAVRRRRWGDGRRWGRHLDAVVPDPNGHRRVDCARACAVDRRPATRVRAPPRRARRSRRRAHLECSRDRRAPRRTPSRHGSRGRELHQAYEGPWRELVHQSGRVLQALSFQPTGAICAAATTSLPETVGGSRNWDYRYSWVRDASFTVEALWVAACPDEVNEFFEYMTTSAACSVGSGDDLQIMFGIGGEHDLTERELPHLPGWRNSAPVRVGNGAWTQRQLDVYGELLNCVYRLSDTFTDLAPETQAFFVSLADTAARRWNERDQGIWEMRGEPRDFVYSKLMCWVALERAIALADRLDARDRVDEWKQVQGEIHDAVMRYGWSDARQRLHPIVRIRRSGRVEPDDGARRVPAGARSAHPGDDRRDRGTAHGRAGTRVPLPDPRRARRRRGNVPALHLLARARDGALRSARAGARGLRTRASPSSTTSGCSPKRSTRRPASCSATSRRRSATSDW